MPRSVAQERRRLTVSIVSTILSMGFLTAVYFKGPQWVVLVFSLGFMAGYIAERLQLSRSLRGLLVQCGPSQSNVQ